MGMLIIDDFSSGPDVLELPTTGKVEQHQPGNTIIGGTRLLRLVCDKNPLLQLAHLEVRSGSLNLSTGVNQIGSVGIEYGLGADPNSQMSLDLRGFDSFRFHFLSNQVLSLNVVLLGGGGTFEHTVPVPVNSNPFTLDFLSPEFVGEADLSAIKRIAVSAQSSVAGTDHAIDSIEVTGIG